MIRQLIIVLHRTENTARLKGIKHITSAELIGKRG